jgi:hypothetical protein
MTTQLQFRVGRFTTVAFCAAVAAGVLYLLVCLLPDTRPLTAFENIFVYFSAAVAWPFDIFAAFHPDSDPSFAVGILLSFASGLFWASIVELFFTVKRRYVA